MMTRKGRIICEALKKKLRKCTEEKNKKRKWGEKQEKKMHIEI